MSSKRVATDNAKATISVVIILMFSSLYFITEYPIRKTKGNINKAPNVIVVLIFKKAGKIKLKTTIIANINIEPVSKNPYCLFSNFSAFLSFFINR